MVAGVVYFLIAGQNFSSRPPHEQYAKKYGNSREPNAINFLNNYNSINRLNRPNVTSRWNDSPSNILLHQSTHHPNSNIGFSTARLPTTIRPSLSTPSNIFISSTTTAKTTTKSKPQIFSKHSIVTVLQPTASTTIKPTYESNKKETITVKNVKIYTNSSSRRKLPQPAPKHTTLLLPTTDDLRDDENAVEKSKLLFPSKETFENFGFTSGHQNSFGIPIEEDERILRMLNHQLASQSSAPKLEQSNDYALLSITTDANMHQTKVSPTLPNIKKNFATTERIRPVNVTTDDGNSHLSTTFFFSSSYDSCLNEGSLSLLQVFVNQLRCHCAEVFYHTI